MAESFSREKLRQAPQKEGGWKILRYLLPVWVRPLKSRTNGKKTHTHTHTHTEEEGEREREIRNAADTFAVAAHHNHYRL